MSKVLEEQLLRAQQGRSVDEEGASIGRSATLGLTPIPVQPFIVGAPAALTFWAIALSISNSLNS